MNELLTKQNYQSPEITFLSLNVEKGFAASGESEQFGFNQYDF